MFPAVTALHVSLPSPTRSAVNETQSLHFVPPVPPAPPRLSAKFSSFTSARWKSVRCRSQRVSTRISFRLLVNVFGVYSNISCFFFFRLLFEMFVSLVDQLDIINSIFVKK